MYRVFTFQRVITHLKDQNNQLQLRINNLEQRNSFLENQNRELMSRLQTPLSQNKAYDYDLPHSAVNVMENCMSLRAEILLFTQSNCGDIPCSLFYVHCTISKSSSFLYHLTIPTARTSHVISTYV